MREILFRGKSVNDGEWAYGSLVVTTLEPVDDAPIKHYHIEDMTIGCFPNEFQSGLSETVDPNTVGQFTGLTDKNGKKIFEGDIVRATIERSDGCQSPRTEKGVIGYDCIGMIGLILYRTKNGENVWSDFFNELSLSGLIADYYFENIGNIHDNPELLEVPDGQT